MANITTEQFNNQITSLEDMKDYLTQRIAYIKSRDGALTVHERELQDILDMLSSVE